MALGVLDMGKARPLENKLVLIQANGRVAWEYSKAHPVPGFEGKLQVPGDGKLRSGWLCRAGLLLATIQLLRQRLV
jgi:hypothetical protein